MLIAAAPPKEDTATLEAKKLFVLGTTNFDLGRFDLRPTATLDGRVAGSAQEAADQLQTNVEEHPISSVLLALGTGVGEGGLIARRWSLNPAP